MFTGIVEEAGVVAQIKPAANSIQLTVRVKTCARGLKIGDSVAVNGCCLTVAKLLPGKPGKLARFDLLKETWERTNLQFARVGSGVNLERSLLIGGRLGGHFVTGHIDGAGRIVRWERTGKDHVLDIAVPPAVMRHVIMKGLDHRGRHQPDGCRRSEEGFSRLDHPAHARSHGAQGAEGR